MIPVLTEPAGVSIPTKSRNRTPRDLYISSANFFVYFHVFFIAALAFSSQCDQVGQGSITYSCFCSLETPSLFHFFASFSSAFLSVLDCCFHSLLIAR